MDAVPVAVKSSGHALLEALVHHGWLQQHLHAAMHEPAPYTRTTVPSRGIWPYLSAKDVLELQCNIRRLNPDCTCHPCPHGCLLLL